MRNWILAGVAAVMLATGTGVTVHSVDAKAADKAHVTDYNDGFQDGACHKGADGFGNACK